MKVLQYPLTLFTQEFSGEFLAGDFIYAPRTIIYFV